MNISNLTPTWFSFLVVMYDLRDLESNPTTATNLSCGVGKSWYLSASVFHLTNVANTAFCTKYLQTADVPKATEITLFSQVLSLDKQSGREGEAPLWTDEHLDTTDV